MTFNFELRDAVAIETMKLVIESWQNEGLYAGDENNAEVIAGISYKMADAMLAERKKVKELIVPITLDDLELGNRANNVLRAEGVYGVRTLISFTLDELKKMPNMGENSIKIIISALQKHGLSLAG